MNLTGSGKNSNPSHLPAKLGFGGSKDDPVSGQRPKNRTSPVGLFSGRSVLVLDVFSVAP